MKNCQIFERCFFFPYYAILSSLVSSSSHFHTFSDFPLKNQSLHVITENGCGNRVNCRRSRPWNPCEKFNNGITSRECSISRIPKRRERESVCVCVYVYVYVCVRGRVREKRKRDERVLVNRETVCNRVASTVKSPMVDTRGNFIRSSRALIQTSPMRELILDQRNSIPKPIT